MNQPLQSRVYGINLKSHLPVPIATAALAANSQAGSLFTSLMCCYNDNNNSYLPLPFTASSCLILEHEQERSKLPRIRMYNTNKSPTRKWEMETLERHALVQMCLCSALCWESVSKGCFGILLKGSCQFQSFSSAYLNWTGLESSRALRLNCCSGLNGLSLR